MNRKIERKYRKSMPLNKQLNFQLCQNRNNSYLNVAEFDRNHPLNHVKDSLMSILKGVEQQIEFKQAAFDCAFRLIQQFDIFYYQYQQLSKIEHQNSQINLQEPASLNVYPSIPQQHKSRKQEKKRITINHKENASTPPSMRYYNDEEQSQICLQNHSRLKEELKKMNNNKLFNLPFNQNNNNRLSQGQYYSQQIQSLLRRKKQLLLCSVSRQERITVIGQKQMNNSKIKARNMSKKDYFYDYDGEKKDILNKKRNFTTKNEEENIFQLKVQSGCAISQSNDILNKKGLIQKISQYKKNMKRKQLQNTCQLAMDKFENQSRDKDLEQIVSINTKTSKGVTFLQQSRQSIQILRFPSVK